MHVIDVYIRVFSSGCCGRRMKWLKLRPPPSPSSTTTLCSWCWWWWGHSCCSSPSLLPITMCSVPWEQLASLLYSPQAHSRGTHHILSLGVELFASRCWCWVDFFLSVMWGHVSSSKCCVIFWKVDVIGVCSFGCWSNCFLWQFFQHMSITEIITTAMHFYFWTSLDMSR